MEKPDQKKYKNVPVKIENPTMRMKPQKNKVFLFQSANDRD